MVGLFFLAGCKNSDDQNLNGNFGSISGPLTFDCNNCNLSGAQITNNKRLAAKSLAGVLNSNGGVETRLKQLIGATPSNEIDGETTYQDVMSNLSL